MDRLKDLLEMDQEKESERTATLEPEYTEVEIYAFTIEDALKKSAEALKTSIINLEYEILERGQNGFLGFGKKPFKILVKSTAGSASRPMEKPFDEMDLSFEQPAFAENQDGTFKVFVTTEGIFLKISSPVGKGTSVNLEEVQKELISRDILKYNENAVKNEVGNPKEKPVKIAEYIPSQLDSKFQLQISPDEMKAFVTISKPEKYGRQLNPSEIISALKSKKVAYGIKEIMIKDAIENELHNMPIMVAEGDMPIEGKDAQIKYHFKVEKDGVKFEIEEDGSVDFHKLDIVQSVVVGQVLATKVLAERGKSGKTLSSRIIPARDGKDIKLISGNNTHISPDGTQIIADINGQVIFKNNKIQVEPVLEVSGDVDLSTGDINFPGNIMIYGNVNDTFKVYSGANIEIKGNIGKASVVAEGNIIVRQGIQGKDEAKIVCAGDLYAKFIERSNVKAEGYVVVSEVILHSNVECKQKILCQGGKKSQIAGGRTRALYEINAKLLGAESYTETLLEVGVDPEAEDKLVEIHRRKDEIAKELPEITKQLATLTQLQSTGPLPPEKEEQFNLLTIKNSEFRQENGALDEQLSQIEKYLDSLGKDAKVAASKIVFPGVKVKIKKEVLIVKNEYKFVTFFKEGANIRIAPYEKAKEMEEKLKAGEKARKK
jgi:uncharacterized protein (DUF342 family)